MLKIRCSQIGKIMHGVRGKKDVLTKGNKSYIEQLVIEDVTGRKKEIQSKYLKKGIISEQESIELASKVLNLGFIYKNDESFENDYLTGTPDVNTDSCLLDVKSKWDLWTYSSLICNKNMDPDIDYYWQMQGYMALTKKRKAYLVYCIPDTPQDITEDEVRAAHWNERLIEESEELRKYVEHNHNFEDLPTNFRVVSYLFKYEKEAIKDIYSRIDLCREYYNEVCSDIQNHIDNHIPREFIKYKK